MASNTPSKSTSALLIFLLVLITFPFWIGFFGLAVGIVGGVIGGVFGIVFGTMGGLIGAVMGIITLPFKIIFGHGHWHWFPHINGFVVAVLIILAIVLARRKSK